MSPSPLPSLLLTGATGFLGNIMYPHLQKHFRVTRLGRSAKNEITADLVTLRSDLPQSYDCLVHAAGWAHRLPQSEAQARTFWQINHHGTENLLAACSGHPPKAMVLISTVAVYGRESGENIREDAPLQGDTPYAASKLAAERDFRAWAQQRHIPYLVLRLPLVIGPNPPGNLGAIRKAIQGGYFIMVKDNTAKKSVVDADDVALLIIDWLQREEKTSGTFNLTDGQDPYFNDIVNAIAKAENKSVTLKLSKGKLRLAAKLGDGAKRLGLPAPLRTDILDKMTSTLTFSCERAKEDLGWQPKSGVMWFKEQGSRGV